MQTAIFGITNDGLNLAVNLILLILVVVWIALIVYTFLDARRRIEDPVLVACATIASFVPYVGTAVYAILRPPEFLEDARERELEIQAAEMKVRELSERSCPNCSYTVEKNFLRCPNCQRRLKDPCHSCGKPVDPRWALCPYCETPMPGRARGPRRGNEPPEAGDRGDRRERERPRRSGRSERAERKEEQPKDRRTNRPAPSAGDGNSSPSSREDSVPPPPPPPRRRSQAPPEDSDEDGGSGGSRRRPEPPTRANR